MTGEILKPLFPGLFNESSQSNLFFFFVFDHTKKNGPNRVVEYSKNNNIAKDYTPEARGLVAVFLLITPVNQGEDIHVSCL